MAAVGAGGDAGARLVVQLHHSGADVVAVDLDPAFAAQSDRRRRVARAHPLRPTQVRLVRADARRLPFAAAQFDGFTAVSALEHVTGAHGDRQALAECARVLRPGGVGLVMVPSAPTAVCRS